MMLISHRGNLNGPNKDRENSPQYIKEALALHYKVEIDVWAVDDKLMLGHDEPQYDVPHSLLGNWNVFFHAKNLEASIILAQTQSIYFFHDKDPYVFTSHSYIWTYPGQPFNKKCIVVHPEVYPFDTEFSMAAGVCSDYIQYISSNGIINRP